MANDGKVKPVKEKASKTTIIKTIMDDAQAAGADITRRQAEAIYNGLERMMIGSMVKGGVGEFTFPGMFKVVTRIRPAIRKGTMVRNPATGGMSPHAGRPAGKVIKVRALSKLKQAVA